MCVCECECECVCEGVCVCLNPSSVQYFVLNWHESIGKSGSPCLKCFQVLMQPKEKLLFLTVGQLLIRFNCITIKLRFLTERIKNKFSLEAFI